mgnify:FL=1
MVFSSFVFLFRFLPVFLIIYFIAPEKFRNLVLFAGSIAFYTYGEAAYVLLLLASVVINYLIGVEMNSQWARGSDISRRVLLFTALFYDFGMLFFFKYSGMSEKLPLGISFYTFQIAAYVMDVYWKKVPEERSFINLGTYLTMFPQLIAGPIVNYAEVNKSLRKRMITFAEFEQGIRVLIIGLGAKVIIADRIGMLWNNVQTIGFNSISTKLAWLGAIAYSMELYFDFSGYSMMAIGLGKMLGFQIPVNFRFPYISKSITEFWRRWHITLGRWFRDYVYIPLGGNRKGKGRTLFNLFVVWSLTALWHGADYNFLIWGGMLLGLMFIEKLFLYPYLEKSKVLSHLYLLLVVPVTWVAFAISDVHQLGIYLARMFPVVPIQTGVINPQDFANYLKDYAGLLLLGAIFSTPLPAKIYGRIRHSVAGIIAVAVIFFLSMYYLAISENNPFLYFNF